VHGLGQLLLGAARTGLAGCPVQGEDEGEVVQDGEMTGGDERLVQGAHHDHVGPGQAGCSERGAHTTAQLRVMEARQGARGRWKGQRYGPVLQGQGVCGGACTVRGEQVDAVTATPQGIGQSEGALCGGHRGGEQQDLRHASSVLRAASSGGGVVRGGWRSNSRETCSAIPIITTSIAAIAAPSTVRVVSSSQGAKESNPRGTAAE